MATLEQIQTVLELMDETRPVDIFRTVDQTNAGIGAVLRILHESDEMVNAGRISDELNVSTARVAVLLRKMTEKGLIIREHNAVDGRVTVVRLTESGQETASRMRDDLYARTAHIIDSVGEERLMQFFSIAAEIRAAADAPDFDF